MNRRKLFGLFGALLTAPLIKLKEKPKQFGYMVRCFSDHPQVIMAAKKLCEDTLREFGVDPSTFKYYVTFQNPNDPLSTHTSVGVKGWTS